MFGEDEVTPNYKKFFNFIKISLLIHGWLYLVDVSFVGI
jgi:hypothetical protein